MDERKHLGQMMVGACPVCEGVVAAMWLDRDVKDREKRETVGDWYLRGLKIDTLERYDDDPMPQWCGKHCERYRAQAMRGG